MRARGAAFSRWCRAGLAAAGKPRRSSGRHAIVTRPFRRARISPACDMLTFPSCFPRMLPAMLSPTSFSGLSSAAPWASRIRTVNPSQAAAQPVAPAAPVQRALPGGGGQTDGQPSRVLPRGSLLDLSV